MSQFHNLFRKVVGEKEQISSHPVEDGPELGLERTFAFQKIRTERIFIEGANRIVFHTDPKGPGADRFRLLRMRLRERAKTHKLKTLLITSPLPHDGKSTVSLNLATALAEGGKRTVLLVEADLHHAQILEQFGLEASDGFG